VLVRSYQTSPNDVSGRRASGLTFGLNMHLPKLAEQSIALLESAVIDGSSSIPTAFIAPTPSTLAAIF
jgi:hypothetical protein